MTHRINQAARRAYADRNKPPKPGVCACPSGGLDYAKIALVMGAAKVVCMKCGKRVAGTTGGKAKVMK